MIQPYRKIENRLYCGKLILIIAPAIFILSALLSACSISGALGPIAITASPESTIYFENPSEKSITLSTDNESVDIHYTTDGSEPDNSSAKYIDPINITDTTVIKAKAYSKGKSVSETASFTYIFYTMETVPEYNNPDTADYSIHFPYLGNTNSASIDPNVYLSPYKIGRYEIPKLLYDTVHTWAQNHGYGIGEGEADDNTALPARSISWYDATKWCNAFTQYYNSKKGTNLEPVYYTNSDHTAIYKTGTSSSSDTENFTYEHLKWDADGFRLPTEPEYEYAARRTETDNGGEALIDPNYYSGYDGNPDAVTQYAWIEDNTSGEPMTVGAKSANYLGLYDMTGNVAEWCWRIFSETTDNSQKLENPRSTSDEYRPYRGGSYKSSSSDATVTTTASNLPPDYPYNHIGFRVVRRVMP